MKLGLSLIEVKYGSFYKTVVKNLIKSKARNFHIDICGPKFTGRKIFPENKIKFLKKYKNNKVDFHIMDFHEKKGGDLEKILEKLIKYFFLNSKIYFHLKSFKQIEDFEKILIKAKKNNFIPGLVIEINQNINLTLKKIINKNYINSFLIMGYKEGKGAQKFNTKSIENYKELLKIIPKNYKNLNFEFDGGLSFKNILELKKLRFNQLNGWSIISSKKINEVMSQYNLVNYILKK
jgi:pentose-5-phosphate-3-epimerase